MALQYELFYLVGESKEQGLAAIRTEVEKLVMAEGGTFLSDEMEERRKLAYPIKKEARGIYVTRRFSLPSPDERKKGDSEEAIAKISRQLHLYRDVLRFIVVRAEGLPSLGEREVVPQLPGRDSRRRDSRGGAPRPTAPVHEPVKPDKEAVAPASEPASAGQEKETAMSASPEAVSEKAPKEESVKEEEIDKKLDEILDI